MKYTKKTSPTTINNNLYHTIGSLLIVMNKVRHMLLGYKTPRTFPVTHIKQTVDYDLKIVDRWINYVRNYSGDTTPVKDKVVLELGVGPDLGTGLILLAMGAKKYFALDVHNLASFAPKEFYKSLFQRLRKDYDYNVDFAEEQLEKFQKGEDSGLCYVVDKNFNISDIPEEVDIIITQVAFEHFDDVENAIKEMSIKIKKGGILFSHIDMNTHTRWIKDKDPLNIYRYNDLFWNMFKFKGSPNRVRIPQYVNYLEGNNWSNIVIEPRTVLEEEYVEKVLPTLSKKFRDLNVSEMKKLSFILMSKKD
ncbi:MAG: methyltransferase domain-containing protein [Nitrospirae bacterium]|nr:methyltransferase domain-containing protein [Nitrospirota bacterium]